MRDKELQKKIDELITGIIEIIGNDLFILKYKPDRFFDEQQEAINYYEKIWLEEVNNIKNKFN